MKTLVRALIVGGSIAVACVAVILGCTHESEKLDQTGERPNATNVDSIRSDPALTEQLPEKIRRRGTLLVGSNMEYPPAEFLDAQGQPTGYDLEIARALGKKLGLRTEVQNAEFTAILPALGVKYDVGASSFTINAERLKSVTMIAVFREGTSWSVQRGNPQNVRLEALCGLTVGVQVGTVQEISDLAERNARCEREGKPPINVVALKSQGDITTRLVNGSVAAMVADASATGYAVKQTHGKVERLGAVYGHVLQGLTVAKSDARLAAVVHQALEALKAEGVYQKILEHWGVEDSQVSDFIVNPEVG